MQGQQSVPPMDVDPVGPRHWVAGGPIRYKHGMRDEKRGRDQEESVGRAAQQPQENGKTRDAGNGPCWMTGCGKGERNIAALRTRERWMTDSAEQQPRGIEKPVAMDW